MATMQPTPATPGPPVRDDTTFTRGLKWEAFDDEGRALVRSYLIAFALGILWLLLVYFGPKVPPRITLMEEAPPIDITLDELPPPQQVPPTATTSNDEGAAATGGTSARTPAPGPTNRAPGRTGPRTGSARQGPAGSRTESNSRGAVGDAFGTGGGSGTGGMVGDVSGILRGVDVGSGSGGTGGGLGGSGGGGGGGRAVLGQGEGGGGSRTPGRGGIGGGSGTGGGGGGGIGGVGSGGGGALSRAPVRISPPRAIDVPDVGGPRRNTDELGTFVRGRESQLRFCYNEYGLKVNPSLAGSISTSITLTASGDVTNVGVTNRSWSGPGSAEAERCIRNRISGWNFPSGTAGTYGFSFNFTR